MASLQEAELEEVPVTGLCESIGRYGLEVGGLRRVIGGNGDVLR